MATDAPPTNWCRIIAFLIVPEKHGRYDKTELLLLGQQRAPVAVLVDGDTATFAAGFESGIDFFAAIQTIGRHAHAGEHAGASGWRSAYARSAWAKTRLRCACRSALMRAP